MKKYILLIVLMLGVTLQAQFKDQLNKPVDIKSGILSGDTSSLFGFLNSDNLKMHHTFDLSYQAFGGHGIALGVYTNSLMYKFSDQLNVQADLSLVNSPYNSFGKEFASQINGFYLSRAQINYKPTENTTIMLQYQNMPMNFYNPFYGYSPFYRGSYFDDNRFGKE